MEMEHILKSGTLLSNGRYRIDNYIGQGGFGITYKATNINADKQGSIVSDVVIKELFILGCSRKGLDVTEQLISKDNYAKAKQRFLEEAEILKKFDSPNIVKVFDVFEENNTVYYVMVFTTGITLKELIDKQPDKRLTIADSLKYITQLLLAIEQVHSKNLLHSDIKPSNVMITPNGSVVLIDFGSARQYAQDKQVSQTIMISHGYASPEQYSEKHERKAYSDIYSIGATLYYCITGHKPMDALDRFRPGTSEDLIEQPQKYNKQIPDKINNIILKSLHINSDIRYQTAKEMLDEMDEKTIKLNKPIEKPPISKNKYNKTLIFSLIAALIIIIALLINKCDSGDKKIDNAIDTISTEKVVLNAEREKHIIDSIAKVEKEKIDAEAKADAEAKVKAEAIKNANYTETTAGLNIKMVFIKGGTFIMGSPESEVDRENNEMQHRVTLSNFYIGRYEVTQKQWRAVMGNNPSHFTNCDNCPVEMISWYDAQEFIKKLNAKMGKTYRLPTEAEWEYACRAGTTTPFNTGHNLTTSQANYDGSLPYNNNAKGVYRKKTMPVGSFAPNAWGLYDMHGNVGEWCSDWYGNYTSDAKTNPTGPISGSYRALRGGSWYCISQNCRSANRFNSPPPPVYSGFNGGFRLVFSSK